MMTSQIAETQPVTTADNTASQLGHWLEEYGEITTILPVLVGLLVTTRLQLRGANALLANIGIAALTRQVIVQLKKQAGHQTPADADANGSAATAASADEDYTIVHSVPGRIRLRIPRLQNDAMYAQRLEKLLLAEDITLSVRVNRAASSLVVHYDSAGLTDLELGMRLLQVLERAEQGE